jgi:DNA-binding transcriptional LysR family regulator
MIIGEMNKIQFDRLDLNLLRVLDLLLEQNSIVDTAARLVVTPSAVSHALRRLRYELGDRLFVRRGNRLEPTPRALEIRLRLNPALGQIRFALDKSVFDPATTDREYTLLGHAYVTATVLPQIAGRFNKAAPAAHLRYLNHGNGRLDVIGELESGRADVALGTAPLRHSRLVFEELFSDKFVWVMRAGHPLAKGRKITLEAVSRGCHLIIETLRTVYGDEPTGVPAQIWRGTYGIEGLLAKRGLSHTVGASAPDTVTGMAFLAQSDLMALMPRRVATALNTANRFCILEPSHPTSELRFGMCFHRDRAAETSIAWFLDLVRAAAAS